MRLYVLRHGRAVQPDVWAGDEAARPLTDDGRERMRSATRGLRLLGVAPDVVLSSPYARAHETAEIVAGRLGAPVEEAPALAPGAQLEQLLPLLMAHRAANELMIVGHEPDLSTLLGELIAAPRAAHITLKKGACGCVELGDILIGKTSEEVRVRGRGSLLWLMTARQLAALRG